MLKEGLTPKEAGRRKKISRSGVYQALKSIRETGTTPRRNKQGRKAGLSGEQEKELVEWVRRKTEEGNCPNVREVWEEARKRGCPALRPAPRGGDGSGGGTQR